jgi:hypothetical protein
MVLSSDLPPSEFGSCCKDWNDVMTIPGQKFFFVSEEGVLYLTVGAVQTGDGTGWLDHSVFFCPFCGKQLQTAEEVRRKAAAPPPSVH